eukprot:GHVS01028566.1.p1 GENE.GHVS01028566.1~~GHVS01028566.1.p1  ORF type:complete len:946 (+),score=208.62 GHVS01028566.1:168-3005(+)
MKVSLDSPRLAGPSPHPHPPLPPNIPSSDFSPDAAAAFSPSSAASSPVSSPQPLVPPPSPVASPCSTAVPSAAAVLSLANSFRISRHNLIKRRGKCPSTPPAALQHLKLVSRSEKAISVSRAEIEAVAAAAVKEAQRRLNRRTGTGRCNSYSLYHGPGPYDSLMESIITRAQKCSLHQMNGRAPLYTRQLLDFPYAVRPLYSHHPPPPPTAIRSPPPPCCLPPPPPPPSPTTSPPTAGPYYSRRRVADVAASAAVSLMSAPQPPLVYSSLMRPEGCGTRGGITSGKNNCANGFTSVAPLHAARGGCEAVQASSIQQEPPCSTAVNIPSKQAVHAMLLSLADSAGDEQKVRWERGEDVVEFHHHRLRHSQSVPDSLLSTSSCLPAFDGDAVCSSSKKRLKTKLKKEKKRNQLALLADLSGMYQNQSTTAHDDGQVGTMMNKTAGCPTSSNCPTPPHPPPNCSNRQPPLFGNSLPCGGGGVASPPASPLLHGLSDDDLLEDGELSDALEVLADGATLRDDMTRSHLCGSSMDSDSPPPLPQPPTADHHRECDSPAAPAPPSWSDSPSSLLASYRAKHIGMLVSSVKAEWNRRYSSYLPLELIMGYFGFKRLKSLLQEVPGLVLMGEGGFMRVTTLQHYDDLISDSRMGEKKKREHEGTADIEGKGQNGSDENSAGIIESNHADCYSLIDSTCGNTSIADTSIADTSIGSTSMGSTSIGSTSIGNQHMGELTHEEAATDGGRSSDGSSGVTTITSSTLEETTTERYRETLQGLVSAVVNGVCQQQHSKQLLWQLNEAACPSEAPLRMRGQLNGSEVTLKEGVDGVRQDSVANEWSSMFGSSLLPLLNKAGYEHIEDMLSTTPGLVVFVDPTGVARCVGRAHIAATTEPPIPTGRMSDDELAEEVTQSSTELVTDSMCLAEAVKVIQEAAANQTAALSSLLATTTSLMR